MGDERLPVPRRLPISVISIVAKSLIKQKGSFVALEQKIHENLWASRTLQEFGRTIWKSFTHAATDRIVIIYRISGASLGWKQTPDRWPERRDQEPEMADLLHSCTITSEIIGYNTSYDAHQQWAMGSVKFPCGVRHIYTCCAILPIKYDRMCNGGSVIDHSHHIMLLHTARFFAVYRPDGSCKDPLSASCNLMDMFCVYVGRISH